MRLRFANSKPIWETASLLATSILLVLGLVLFLNWTPLILEHVSWGSRPFPPTPAEASLADCQNSIAAAVILVVLLSSVSLRLVWLRRGRKYEWMWATSALTKT